MDLNQIIKFFISTSFIITAIIYLAKLVIEKFAESKIEKYKTDLEKNTESFRYELNKIATEHQIKYSKLYEQRGQVIQSMYNFLIELENSLSYLTSFFQGSDWINFGDRDNKAVETIHKVRQFLETNRIFFSEILCQKIENILNNSNEIVSDMWQAKRERTAHLNDFNISVNSEQLVKPLDKWAKADNKVQNELKQVRLELASEFRKLIGVE